MLPYHKMTPADEALFKKYLTMQGFKNSELTYADNVIWMDQWTIHLAEVDGSLFITNDHQDLGTFLYPISSPGKPVKPAIELAIEDMRSRNLPFIMRSVPEEYKEQLIAEMPETFDIEPDIDFFDYIYSAEDLRKLAGRKYHGKRNHISRLEKNHEYIYEELKREHADE